MGRVLVLGSVNVDLVTRVRRHPRPGETVLGEGLRRLAGGKGANQAVAAAAAGAEVALAGCVGDDAAGRDTRERLRARGVATSALRTVPGPTGQAWVAVDDEGENTIVVVPGANASLGRPELDPAAALGPGDVLLAQLEVPLDVVGEAVRRAAAAGARVVLNLAPYAPLPPDVLALADPAVTNEHEALQLADSGAVPGSVLVTFGAGGAAWDGRPRTGPVVEVDEVRDTTGAGDAFCGALAAALARGEGREAALDAALAAGAASVRRDGAQPDPEL